MYQTIREYQTSPQSVEEVMHKVEKSFVPFIGQAAGFRDYTCTDSGSGTITTVSLFENRSDGEKFNAVAKNWVTEHLGSLLPTAPRVIAGEVRTHATGKVLAS